MSGQAIELVVARFEEELAWLRRVPPSVRVRVYNKGPDVAVPRPGAQVDPLPNVGREAHAYLHHIARHYDDLAPVSVFVQGKPFDHVPDLHRILRGLADGTESMPAFQWLGFLVDEDDAEGARLFQNWSKNPERRPLPMRSFWPLVFGDAPCPGRFAFFGGGNWIVRDFVVRSRPRAFYERALDVAGSFPDAAHCFERCWDRVFGVDGLPPEIRAQPMPVYLKPIRRLMDAKHPAPGPRAAG